jgi:hypothetical protein
MEAVSDTIDKPVGIMGMPLYEELMKRGIGPFLN